MKVSDRGRSNLVTILGIVLIAFAVPHFVDDFLHEMPDEFGMTIVQAQMLGGLFFALLAAALVMAGRGRRAGYYGLLSFGLFLAAAVILKHLPGLLAEEPYWGGAVSEGNIIGLMVTGPALALASLWALVAHPSEEA